MAQAYLSSDNVSVFPTTRRTHSQKFSTRLMTESAIARIINKLIDYEGFVISDEINNTLFELNLWGYYFQLTDFLTLLNSSFNNIAVGSNVTAVIYIDTSNSQFEELYVPAENSSQLQFQGILFISGETPASISGCEIHSLIIAEKTANGWVIPDDNQQWTEAKQKYLQKGVENDKRTESKDGKKQA